MNYLDESVQAMQQALFGKNAIHVPLNIVVQTHGDMGGYRIVAVVGQSSSPLAKHPLTFESKKAHQLILGDAIIRPRLIIDSDAFIGHGLNGLARLGPNEWLENPHGILLNATGEKLNGE